MTLSWSQDGQANIEQIYTKAVVSPLIAKGQGGPRATGKGPGKRSAPYTHEKPVKAEPWPAWETVQRPEQPSTSAGSGGEESRSAELHLGFY